MASPMKAAGTRSPLQSVLLSRKGRAMTADTGSPKAAKSGRVEAVHSGAQSVSVSPVHSPALKPGMPHAQDQQVRAADNSGTRSVGNKAGRPSSKSDTKGNPPAGTLIPMPDIGSTAVIASIPRSDIAKSKVLASKAKGNIVSPKYTDWSPRDRNASPKTGVASPRAGTGRSAKRLSSTRPGVVSPKQDDPTPEARITSHETGITSPKVGAARSKTNSPKKKSGALSPKPDVSSPGSGFPGRKSGIASPKSGIASPRRGAASPEARVAIPDAVTSSAKAAVTSPRTSVLSPKASARTPTSGTASAKKFGRGATSPVVSSPTGSVARKSKKGASKMAIESPSKSGTAAKAKAEAETTKRRRLTSKKRHSVAPAAIIKMVRKSLKRQTGAAGEGSTGENSMSSKDQMSLIMVASVGGFLFVFVILVTFFYLISGTYIPEGIACITEECLKAQEYLDGIVDEAKDPCVDFYGYVCHSWRPKGTSFHTDAVLNMLFRLNTTLFRKRVQFRRDEQRQGMHILGPIYRSCYHYMSTSEELKEALQEAHTVLLIGQLMQAASFFDVVRYLVRQSLQLGVYALFHVRFIYESGRPMLFMHEGYSLEGKLGQSLDSEDTRRQFVEVLKLRLNRDNVSDAFQQLVDIDAQVRKFFNGTKLAIEKQQSLEATVNGLVVNVTAKDWVAAVSDSHRHTLVLVPTDEIIVRGAEIFKPAMQIVVKRGLGLAKFYLSTVFEADVVYILSIRQKMAESEVHKATYCLLFAHKTLALTWAYLAAQYLSPYGSTGVVYNMLSVMKERVADETSEVFGWMKGTTRAQATDTVSKTALDVIAGEGFNVSRVDYTGPEPPLDESASFLRTLAAALRHHHTVMAVHPPTRMEMLISDLEFANTLTYIKARRNILVPTIYQNDPYLYTFRVPDYFNYGTLGALIAVNLAEVVGIGVKHPSQSSWDQDTATNHAQLRRCLVERRMSMGFGDGDLEPGTADAQQSLMLTLSVGVRLAYLALVDAFRKKAGTSKVFNDYLPEAQHVFFVRFCLLWCSATETPDPLTPREKCMLPLYNMEEFAERYNCKGHANFTIAEICQV